MILEIDVGNTRTKWRIKDQQRIVLRGVQATADISNALQIDMNVYSMRFFIYILLR